MTIWCAAMCLQDVRIDRGDLLVTAYLIAIGLSMVIWRQIFDRLTAYESNILNQSLAGASSLLISSHAASLSIAGVGDANSVVPCWLHL